MIILFASFSTAVSQQKDEWSFGFVYIEKLAAIVSIMRQKIIYLLPFFG